MSTHITPAPEEIDPVIFDMIAAEAAQVPDDTSLDESWSSVALDPVGRFRGYGLAILRRARGRLDHRLVAGV